MLDTFQAIAVALLALLPGALYVWGFEREAGQWGISAGDRFLRFVAGSAVLHAVFAPVTYWAWNSYIRTGRLSDGNVSLALWPLVLAYVALPTLVGRFVGVGTWKGRTWARWLTGLNPAPHAWDYVFHQRPQGIIRLKLKRGVWIAGIFATIDGVGRSYAAGFPHPQDLWLAQAVAVDSSTGEFLRNPEGDVHVLESGVLVRMDEVELLDFIRTN